MFNCSSTSPSKLYGTIEVDRPIFTLGPLTDIHGNVWDIHAIYQYYVQAVPKHSLHPYFKDTTDTQYSYVSQTWHPYAIKVVREDGKWKNMYPVFPEEAFI